jgi:hypothetical protein
MEVRFEEGELTQNKYLGEGEHACTIIKVEHQQSKKTGGAMIEVTFADSSQKTTRDWFVLTGNKFKLAGLALAAGFQKASLLSGAFTTEQLMGKQLKVIRKITGQEEYQGKMRDRYENDYLPLGGKQSEQHSDDIPF